MTTKDNVREWTTLLSNAVDDQLLDSKYIVQMCLAYMSEDDVEDMCRANDLKEFLKTGGGDVDDYDDDNEGDEE